MQTTKKRRLLSALQDFESATSTSVLSRCAFFLFSALEGIFDLQDSWALIAHQKGCHGQSMFELLRKRRGSASTAAIAACLKHTGIWQSQAKDACLHKRAAVVVNAQAFKHEGLESVRGYCIRAQQKYHDSPLFSRSKEFDSLKLVHLTFLIVQLEIGCKWPTAQFYFS